MDTQTIKVIIADDHSVFLDGLKMLLETDPLLEIVATATDGKELVERTIALEPDVIVTDIKMPGINGIDAIKEINNFKSIPCIALSTYDNEALIMDALDAGARGYILKNAQRGEIIRGIKTVMNHQPYYCRSTETTILKMIAKGRNTDSSETGTQFSNREIEVIKCISKEQSSEELGKKLFVSKRTIDHIRAKLLIKMNVKSSAGRLINILMC